MKKLKQIITQLKSGVQTSPGEINDTLWQLICYPPKMPLRLQQEQLLDEAEKFSLKVKDEFFAKSDLTFNGFKWGHGKHRLLITHGWGSKATDFNELISMLKQIDGLQLIAFDAPGNGSSAADLSNLLLFVLAVKAVIAEFGAPDIVIGHSLGAMANAMALTELEIAPSLLISLAPLIRLQENFEASMRGVGTSQEVQTAFLQSFETLFGKPASFYNLNNRYRLDATIDHLLIYDENDLVSPCAYILEFLDNYPSVNGQNFEGPGHERIIKSEQVINSILDSITAVLN